MRSEIGELKAQIKELEDNINRQPKDDKKLEELRTELADLEHNSKSRQEEKKSDSVSSDNKNARKLKR